MRLGALIVCTTTSSLAICTTWIAAGVCRNHINQFPKRCRSMEQVKALQESTLPIYVHDYAISESGPCREDIATSDVMSQISALRTHDGQITKEAQSMDGDRQLRVHIQSTKVKELTGSHQESCKTLMLVRHRKNTSWGHGGNTEGSKQTRTSSHDYRHTTMDH